MKYAVIVNGIVERQTFIDAYSDEVFAAKVPEGMTVRTGDGYENGAFTRDGEVLLDTLGQAQKELDKANATIAELRARINELGKTELVGQGTEENPLPLEVGVELVPNAYYTYDDVVYVYMGREANSATEDLLPNGDAEHDFALGWAVL